MTTPEELPEKLSELIGDRSDFTTEEIVQIASQLYDGESIGCGVKITPIVMVSAHLDNKNSVRVSVHVMNHKHMRWELVFDTNHHSLQRACIGGRPPVGLTNLNLQDVVNIFDLGDSVMWHLYDHTIGNASMARREQQRWW